jgi:hypothetical protein
VTSWISSSVSYSAGEWWKDDGRAFLSRSTDL